MSRSMKTGISWSLILLSIVALILLDVVRKPMLEEFGSTYTVGAVRAEAAAKSVVSIVRSDYAHLTERVDPDSALTEAQVEAMVREAVRLGGIEQVVRPDHRWIVIKPNIVELKERGTAVNTDWRVVKALIKIVHEIAPDARITIAEGAGGWVSPGHPEVKSWGDVADGFEIAGYRQLPGNPELSGIALDIVDLNFDEAVETTVPQGGYAKETYFIPRTVLECDVLINVPVMKVTFNVGMTVAMKNFVGIAPGMVYGWAKMRGHPPGSGTGLPHSDPVLDEVIVDLVSLSGVDFTVVDAIVAMERAKSDEIGGLPVRMNTVVAGSDVVAVDGVCARLMDFNPDDVEYITLGERKGLGTGDIGKIEIRGQRIEQIARRFEKCPADWGIGGEYGHYGQGNRIWLLKGPFAAKDWSRDFLDPTDPRALAGEDGWSAPVYFYDDKIDLDTYYHDPTNALAYAYAEFSAPKTQKAELWVGSDEGLVVWVNGDSVYVFEGARKHHLPNDKVEITVRKGTNTLLMKARQTRGRYDFSINICEPEDDDRYNGTRILGLKFSVPTGEKPEPTEATDVAAKDREDYDFGEPEAVSHIKGGDPLEQGDSAPEKKVLEGFPKLPEGMDYMAALQAVLAYRGEPVDVSYLMGISGEAFKFYYDRPDPWDALAMAPSNPLQAVCDALGYTYAYSYNEEQDEAWIRMKGWIHMGYPVMVCNGRRYGGWGVLVGYEEENQKAYLRLPVDGSRGARGRDTSPSGQASAEYEAVGSFLKEWMGSWPGKIEGVGNPQFVVGEKTVSPDPKAVVLRSLRTAVSMMVDGDVEQEDAHRTRTIPGGLHAYRRWWEYMRRDLRYHSMGRREVRALTTFSGPFLNTLIEGRRAASEYLNRIKGHFDAENGARLEQASAHYRTIADRLAHIQPLLPHGGFRTRALSDEESAKAVHRLNVAELVRATYREEHAAIRLLGEVVDIPVPELETWPSVEEQIARGEKLLYWECPDFDGVGDLVIRGEEITTDHIESELSEGMNHIFFRALPDTEGVRLTVKWLEGRGDITVIQQPNAENNYTARIRVDDAGYRREDTYKFEVYLVSER